MARTEIHVTTLTPNAAFIANPTGTTADPTNDHVLTLPAKACLEEITIRITQTDATARVATVLAGDSPPADAAGQGNLAQSMAQNTTYYIPPLTSARFLQSDGTVHIDLAASFAGTIEAFWIPRTA